MTAIDLAPLRARLAPWTAAFDARSPRERVLLIAAALAVLVGLALPAGLDTRWQRLQQLDAQRDTLATALQRLQAEAASHQAQHRLTREQAEAELAALRQRHGASATPEPAHPGATAEARAGRAELPGGLVGPDQMLPLLARLIGHHGGLRVRSLQSLGHTAWPDLGTPAGAPATAGAATPPTTSTLANPPTATPPTDGVRLYRHGVELQLEGGYADLLAYLQSLEALPQRLLWGALTVQVDQHPRVRMTLRLYTLSPRANWVEL
jgi:MSHA biogenesis protein MshJ